MAENSRQQPAQSATTKDLVSNNKFYTSAVKLQAINSSQALENPQQTITTNNTPSLTLTEHKTVAQKSYLQTPDN